MDKYVKNIYYNENFKFKSNKISKFTINIYSIFTKNISLPNKENLLFFGKN